MFFSRKIYPELKAHLSVKQITVLTGMRRTGKTTLVKRLLEEVPEKNKRYLDFERLDYRELFSQKNYENIIAGLRNLGLDPSKKMFLALDEIQLLPQSTSAVKYLYDNYDIKFILTGSSSYYLKNLFSESLSGRKKIFELMPLDFSEYLVFKKLVSSERNFFSLTFSSFEYEQLKSFYEDYVSFGGFPEIVLEENPQIKKDLAQDILSSYVNIDIKLLSDFKNSSDIYNLIKLLAARTGSRLDYSKLASVSGLSRLTVKAYLDLFEKTYLIHRVKVISKNPDREIVKAKKLYFCDNGILNVLASVGSGAQFENAVYNQLHNKGDISYYALKTGKEIDFILDNQYALEAKERPAPQDKSDLAGLAKTAHIPNFRLIGRHKVPNFDDYIWAGQI